MEKAAKWYVKKDLDIREYHLKRVGDGKEFELSWNFDRPYSENWKSQYKCNKQYNIHTSVKNTASIRKRYDDEFSKDEIDYMLKMDFLSCETENWRQRMNIVLKINFYI